MMVSGERALNCCYSPPVADPLIRKLASLHEPELRFDWLASWLSQTPPETLGPALEQLLERAGAFETAALSAVFPLVGWTAGAVDPAAASQLLQHARRASHYHLQRLLEHSDACEVDFSQGPKDARVPDYGRQRPPSLGERKSLARHPSRKHFDQLLSDPHPAVIEKLLANPRLTEMDVLRLVTQRPARVELQALVARTPRWLLNVRVRLGITLNPRTPLWQSQPLLSTFRRQELREVLRSEHIPSPLRECAREHYDRRPPVPRRVRVEGLQ